MVAKDLPQPDGGVVLEKLKTSLREGWMDLPASVSNPGGGGGAPAAADDETPCMVCGRTDGEESFVLCDGCPKGGHYQCLKMPGVPSGDWYCQSATCRGEPSAAAAREGEGGCGGSRYGFEKGDRGRGGGGAGRGGGVGVGSGNWKRNVGVGTVAAAALATTAAKTTTTKATLRKGGGGGENFHDAAVPTVLCTNPAAATSPDGVLRYVSYSEVQGTLPDGRSTRYFYLVADTDQHHQHQHQHRYSSAVAPSSAPRLLAVCGEETMKKDKHYRYSVSEDVLRVAMDDVGRPFASPPARRGRSPFIQLIHSIHLFACVQAVYACEVYNV